ncbi:MAG TPA: hypothetical protein VFZ99_05830, partial [Terriglobales bacterium]
MKKYRGILLLTAALLGLITIDAAAQSTFTRILGPSDQEVVPPSDSLQAHKDAAGLQEILAF